MTVWQRRVLRDHVNGVHAEPIDAPIEPPAHHCVDGLPDLGVLPVEVGLLAGEQVQVVLA